MSTENDALEEKRRELRTLAEAATAGPWVGCAHVAGTDPECPCRYRGDVWSKRTDEVLFQLGVGPDRLPEVTDEDGSWRMTPATPREQGYANGRYLAALDPQTVIALLDALDAAEATR